MNDPAILALIDGHNAQQQFCCEYQHGASTWALTIHAVDAADAVAKVRSIKASLVLLGKLEQRIDANDEGQP